MSSASFTRMATVYASTKRPPAISSGKRGVPVTHLTVVKCLPLATVNAELAERAGIRTPYEAKSTVVDGALDIGEGDVLVIEGVEYAIRAVEEYPWLNTSTAFRRLVVEEVKAV